MDYKELITLIKQRRSIRSFKNKNVERWQIERLIEAAIWAPSGSNAQAWHFVAIDDPYNLRRLSAFLPGVWKTPPTMICLCIDCELEYIRAGKLGVETLGIMDIAMAAQNIMLMAEVLHLGSCVIKGFNSDVLKIALSLPDHIKPELLMVIGYPLKPAKAPSRKPLNQILHWQQYQQKNEAPND